MYKRQEVNHAEEVGDKLYLDAVHSLYLEEKDPILVLSLIHIYPALRHRFQHPDRPSGWVNALQ